MTRIPLRPLPRILDARARGENPDQIERANLRTRHLQMQSALRRRAESRLLVLLVALVMAFGTIGARMAILAATPAAEPQVAGNAETFSAQRADITDRNGAILATNLATNALYARPPLMIDARHAAEGLAAVFPDLDAESLLAEFTGSRKFIWIKRKISPEQMEAVNDIGEPGLRFGPREMRLYPGGRLAAHVLGGYGFGRESVDAAEIIGVAGIELQFDAQLRDVEAGQRPLVLSLDISVQASTEHVLAGGMRLMAARAGAAVLMDVETGEVLALASLPDFDPNDRPAPNPEIRAGDSPLFNRAAQGVYELGSVFKTFNTAMVIEAGVAQSTTMIDTTGPILKSGFKIRDTHAMPAKMSVADVLVQSSNTGSARLAMLVGSAGQQKMLERLGLFAPTTLELPEARLAQPILPRQWGELSTMTVAYGHGIAASPLHVAAAYATIVNGGRAVTPTLLKGKAPVPGAQVVNPETSAQVRAMLRRVVTEGTARMAAVRGYAVAGKTGTADKPAPGGGYLDGKVISSFVATFPADAPQYVLVVMLDEPEVATGEGPKRTAGWTAAPVAAEIIRRTAPMLGLRPVLAPADQGGYLLSTY